MTTRTDSQVDTPQEHRRPTRPDVSRPSRRRIWLRRAGVVILVPLLWLSWSIGGALAAPGTDTTAARLAECARCDGLGWVVSELEQVQYQLNPPKVGGSLAGGIPLVSAPRVASGLPSGTSRAKPSIAVPSPSPPQAQPALPNEGVWQTLTSVHGQRRLGLGWDGRRNGDAWLRSRG